MKHAPQQLVTTALAGPRAHQPAFSLRLWRHAGLVMATLASAVFLLGAPRAAQAADAAQLVDCLFPAQVRRLGGASVGLTPRRQARVPLAECRDANGEYVESLALPSAASATAAPSSPIAAVPSIVVPLEAGLAAVVALPSLAADPLADLRIWLPLAAGGAAEAQVIAGQLYETQGQFALAKLWYDKAVLQGNSRAMVNLAALYEAGHGVPRDSSQAQRLVYQAAGLPLALATRGSRPHVELVDPVPVLQLPRPSGAEPLLIESPDAQVTLMGQAEAAAGIEAVTVNGESRPYDARGLFSAPLALLGDAPMRVDVSVRDKQGATGEAHYLFRRSADADARPLPSALDAPPGGALAGRRWALVIANQAYQHWDPLDTPLADGAALAGTLRERFGFNVTLLNNATRQHILAALSQLRLKAGPDDQVIVYYAGHGQMDPVTARGYWIPIDGDTRDISRWVSVIDVTDQLSAMQAQHVWVIADSCYSGTLAGSLVARIDTALSAEQRQQHLDQLGARRARVAFTSGGLEPVVDGGSREHSLFARSLLDVLAQVKAPIGAQELARTVTARFSALATPLQVTQQPQYAPIAFAGHEAGDFLLAPRR